MENYDVSKSNICLSEFTFPNDNARNVDGKSLIDNKKSKDFKRMTQPLLEPDMAIFKFL